MFLRTVLHKKEKTMSELRLDVGTANELKLALRASRGSNGSEWADADVKALIGSSLLGQFLDVLRGRADIVVRKTAEAIATIKNILSPVKTITIVATAEKKTADCFADTEKYCRDSGVTNLFPEIQEARGIEQGVVKQTTEKSKFVGMVQSLLGITDIDTLVLSRAAIAHKHIYTLTQIEELTKLQDAGTDVGLLTNGWANFFLVLNKEESVSVVGVIRIGRMWFVCVDSLGDGFVWSAGRRFFSRN